MLRFASFVCVVGLSLAAVQLKCDNESLKALGASDAVSALGSRKSCSCRSKCGTLTAEVNGEEATYKVDGFGQWDATKDSGRWILTTVPEDLKNKQFLGARVFTVDVDGAIVYVQCLNDGDNNADNKWVEIPEGVIPSEETLNKLKEQFGIEIDSSALASCH